MKIEKREVTLNEKDTLKDVFFCERALAKEYVSVAPALQTNTHREQCTQFLYATLQNIFDLADLLYERGKEEEK